MKLTYKLMKNLRENTPILCVRCMRYITDDEKMIYKMILNLEEPLPFILNPSRHLQQLDLLLLLKTPKIQSRCLPHEGVWISHH